MPPLHDLRGKEFGRLAVLRLSGRKSGHAAWLCRCECGRKKVVRSGDLLRGAIRSCGCLERESRIRHGGSRKPEYMPWKSMLYRCGNRRSPDWRLYGARGIRVCDRWLDFRNFLADIGPRPSPKHSIDRIDNNGNYEPGNCRWATMREQSVNTRHNNLLTHDGITLPLIEWARRIGLSKYCLRSRLLLGWTLERALTEPPHSHTRLLTYKGATHSLAEWGRIAGLKESCLKDRLRLGWTLERALTEPPRKPRSA